MSIGSQTCAACGKKLPLKLFRFYPAIYDDKGNLKRKAYHYKTCNSCLCSGEAIDKQRLKAGRSWSSINRKLRLPEILKPQYWTWIQAGVNHE